MAVYRRGMPDYSPDWTKDDAAVVKICPVPAFVTGAIVCRIMIRTFAGQTIDTGNARSGDLGGHLGQWYGKEAKDGHKNDAEIIALHALFTTNAVPTIREGTCYVLGTDGPCDSCKEVFRLLRRQYQLFEFKYLYRRQDLHNHTQGVETAYGWGGDKVIRLEDGSEYYYHYLPAMAEPNPLSEQDRHAVKYVLTRMLPLVQKGIPLKDWAQHVDSLKKREMAPATAAINYARERVSMAVNAWGERRRFGKEDSVTAATRVKAVFEPLATFDVAPLTELEVAEFDRRVTNNATAGAFGNWTAPE